MPWQNIHNHRDRENNKGWFSSKEGRMKSE